MSTLGSQISFDLRDPAEIQYRGVIQRPRWVLLGFLGLLIVTSVWRFVTIGFDLLLLPVLVGTLILAWILFFLAAPGPVTLRDLGESVEFTYPRGSSRQVSFTRRRLRLRLIERTPIRPQSPRRWTLKLMDADCFAIVGSERTAITREAFEFLDAKAIHAWYRPTELVVRGPGPTPSRIRTYLRAT
jgi:hypothetical protein